MTRAVALLLGLLATLTLPGLATAAAAPPAGVPAIRDVTLSPAPGGRMHVEAAVRAADAFRGAREAVRVTVRVARTARARQGRVAFRESHTVTLAPSRLPQRVSVTLSRRTSRWLHGLSAAGRGRAVRVFADHRIDVGGDGVVDHYRRAATTLGDVGDGSAEGYLTLVNGMPEPVNTFAQTAQCFYDQGAEGSDPSGLAVTYLPPGGTVTQGLTPDATTGDTGTYNGPGFGYLQTVMEDWNLAPSPGIQQWYDTGLPQGIGFMQEYPPYGYCGWCSTNPCYDPPVENSTAIFMLIAATVDGESLASGVVGVPTQQGYGFAVYGPSDTQQYLDVWDQYWGLWACGLYAELRDGGFGGSCPVASPGIVTTQAMTWATAAGATAGDPWTLTLNPIT